MIVSTRYLLKDAQRNKYAVPAFNVYNLETMRGVIEAAAELKSPVILALTPGTKKFSGDGFMLDMAERFSKMYPIPIAVHLDHHETFESIKPSIQKGIKSVMIDASMKPYQENVNLVKKVVDFAHRHDVTVEAELGRLGGREENINVESNDIAYTEPEQAKDFVEKTDIDSLAVAIGTAHGLYDGEPQLDMERLKEINKVVNIPLVLHGASDISESTVQSCIREGITKVNIATELKMQFSHAIKREFEKNPDMIDPRDYLLPAVENIKNIAKKKILMCGSEERVDS